MRAEFYQIDAIAPAGANSGEVRGMLRSALAERLGLRYHVVSRQVDVYYLEKGKKPGG